MYSGWLVPLVCVRPQFSKTKVQKIPETTNYFLLIYKKMCTVAVRNS